VYFSTYEVQRQRSALDFLIHVSKAAVLAMADSFSEIAATLPNALEGVRLPTIALRLAMHLFAHICAPQEEMGTDFHDVKVIMHPGEVKVDLNVPWSSLSEIEFLVSGSRCSIYTATFKDQPVVVKVLRKDSRDVDAVMIELETEMKFLTRCSRLLTCRTSFSSGLTDARHITISIQVPPPQHCEAPGRRHRAGAFPYH
jgi:hypothetical protein